MWIHPFRAHLLYNWKYLFRTFFIFAAETNLAKQQQQSQSPQQQQQQPVSERLRRSTNREQRIHEQLKIVRMMCLLCLWMSTIRTVIRSSSITAHCPSATTSRRNERQLIEKMPLSNERQRRRQTNRYCWRPTHTPNYWAVRARRQLKCTTTIRTKCHAICLANAPPPDR